jgi:hypothetical protein
MRTADRRAQRLRRIAVAWLLVAGVTLALAAAQAWAAATHPGCHRPAPVAADSTPAPCPSLLPLACCDATTLPGASTPGPERSGMLAIPLELAAAPTPLAVGPGSPCAAVPPVSPLRFSVVLRL